MGPTAIGKTQLAIEIAEHMDVALISVDSVQVYRSMDIGTAKLSKAMLEQFPHALVDIREPEENYSAKTFLDDVDAAVRDALGKHRIPLLVGGTMMYFKVFRDGMTELPEANPALRESIRREIMERGVDAVYEELVSIDAVAAQKIHPNNIQRMERALEVYRSTGQTISELWEQREKRSVQERLGCELKEIAVMNIDRTLLHERIQVRVDLMLRDGFEDEVRRLMLRPDLTRDSTSMKAVGYKQMWQYLDSPQLDNQDVSVRDSIVFATRQLARRQLVWLRNWNSLDSTSRMQFDVHRDDLIRKLEM